MTAAGGDPKGILRLRAEIKEARRQAWPDPSGWLIDLAHQTNGGSHLASVRVEANEKMTGLPTPLGDHGAAHPQRYLERVIAWCDYLGEWATAIPVDEGERGLDSFPLHTAARLHAAERAAWMNGGPPLPYLHTLTMLGDTDQALLLAEGLVRAATTPGIPHGTLELPTRGAELQRLRDFLDGSDAAPAGFDSAIRQLAGKPGALVAEGVRAQLSIATSANSRAQPRLLARAVNLLRAAEGVSGEDLFGVATLLGASQQAVDLVHEGAVSAAAVEEVALQFAGARSQALWLGLAARAACLADDHLGVVRLLRAACRCADPALPPDMDLAFVWLHADPRLRRMLLSQDLAPPEELR